MLRTMKDLEGYAIQATDGDIGHVKDVYFDDQQWVVRYFVVEAGHWLASRKVLISPFAVGRSDWIEKVLPISITKKQVKNSPDIDTDKPVSRQHEMRYLGYYGYPNYWGGVGPWGNALTPSRLLMNGSYGGLNAEENGVQPNVRRTGIETERDQDGNPNLRSCKEVMSYHIEASDGGIGHVENLLIDEETWAIRYMIVDTSNWWLGHEVLISPKMVQEVRWSDNTVAINATRQAVKDSPPYNAALPVSEAQEMGIYQHHGLTDQARESAIPPHQPHSTR